MPLPNPNSWYTAPSECSNPAWRDGKGGELAPALAVNERYSNLGSRISIYDLKEERLARLGDVRPGNAPHQFWAPHGIGVDSRRDLYVGEVSYSFAGSNMTPPRELRSFRKLPRVT
jgi:hypothetical protein